MDAKTLKPTYAPRDLWEAICAYLTPIEAWYLAVQNLPMVSTICRQLHGKHFPGKAERCSLAAKRNWKIVRFAGDAGCPVYADVMVRAAWFGRLDILAWADDKVTRPAGWPPGPVFADGKFATPLAPSGCKYMTPQDWNTVSAVGDHNIYKVMICESAAEQARYDILEWAVSKNYEKCGGAPGAAAEKGLWGTVKWLHANGWPIFEHVATSAAAQGNLDILKWIHENKLPWNSETCAAAAAAGNLTILKWLRENGCEWKVYADANPTAADHSNIMGWLRADGSAAWREELGDTSRVDIIQWLRRKKIMSIAWRVAHASQPAIIEVIDWLYTITAPWSTN